jgi:2-polyprenyl-3-methyl-5-hydroxy-6-metoxy-1,4-benzoquinol methylase
MTDLSKRSCETELMDDLQASGQIIDVTLKELEKINLLLGGNYVTIDGIDKLLGDGHSGKVSIADVGCGSGDILKLIRKSLAKKGVEAELIGIDANPNIVAYAQAHCPADCKIRFESLNIFSDEFKKREFDIVTGTLFFHHFTNEELVGFFGNLKDRVRVGVIINDIHRHWFAYYSIKWLTAAFSRSAMVKNDAAVSVSRAFRKQELRDILERSGIRKYSIKWMWAFRWQVIIDLRK